MLDTRRQIEKGIKKDKEKREQKRLWKEEEQKVAQEEADYQKQR